jgi:hypothetical protein
MLISLAAIVVPFPNARFSDTAKLVQALSRPSASHILLKCLQNRVTNPSLKTGGEFNRGNVSDFAVQIWDGLGVKSDPQFARFVPENSGIANHNNVISVLAYEFDFATCERIGAGRLANVYNSDLKHSDFPFLS